MVNGKAATADKARPAHMVLSLPKLGQTSSAPRAIAESVEDPARLPSLGIPRLAGKNHVELDEEDGEEQDDESIQVTALVNKIMAKRDQDAKAKQTKMLNETWAKIKGDVEDVQKAVTKDANDVLLNARKAFTKLEDGLESTMKSMQKLTDKYHEEIHALWKTYVQQHQEAGRIKEEAVAMAEKRKLNAKRKISALQADTDKLLTEIEDKLKKIRSKSSKLPAALSMVRDLMGADQ